ncbi:MAG: hypothetical protein Kow0079_06180 [Vicingaceae bacterium]
MKPIYYISFLFVLNVLCLNKIVAQNFYLKSLTNNKEIQTVDLFVEADPLSFMEWCNNHQVKVKKVYGNKWQINIEKNLIRELLNSKSVHYVEYNNHPIQLLNDTMVYNNYIYDIHQGTSPLPSAYKGKNVVLGFIDTGIDINHPDFKDSLGNTRIYRIWDQADVFDGNSYGYGTIWDSTAINNGSCTHIDPTSYFGHGTHVAGVAAGNGNAVGKFIGAAPEATIIMVASDFNNSNWFGTLVDAVDYIYKVADSLGLPCVINASVGDYLGSHDGTDIPALMIDSLVNAKPGRAFVCAAGNAGAYNFHLRHQVNNDTVFSWFKYNASSALGYGAVFYEIWSDTADLNNMMLSIGANKSSGSFSLRAQTPYFNIQNRLGNNTDTLYGTNGDTIAIVETYGELQGPKYLLQVHLQEPDSNNYWFSLNTTGTGKLDVWSWSVFGTSDIVSSGLPGVAQYPDIVNYVLPDTLQNIVSSFSCLPSLITVGSYWNRYAYLDYDSVMQYNSNPVGAIDVSSSIGPTRTGYQKPDLAASGARTIAACTADVINKAINNWGQSFTVAAGGFHRRDGGTSNASPIVAGIAALYLEKCPTATMAEIKNAIINNVYTDNFTGSVPNYRWGYGKANGFEALKSSNFIYALGPDQNICEGDSVAINITGGYTDIIWNTGDTSNLIYADSTNLFYASLTNQSGCKGITDTMNTYLQANPSAPNLVQSNDTLYCFSSENLQWYLNGTPIAGATDSFYVVTQNGDYYAQVTNMYGCTDNSDTLTITNVGIQQFTSIDDILLYPNPVKNLLTIVSKEEPLKVEVYNMLGEITIASRFVKQSLDVSYLSKGVYFLKVVTADKTSIIKFLKE